MKQLQLEKEAVEKLANNINESQKNSSAANWTVEVMETSPPI